MRIVIIGGNGFIGSAFIKYASRREMDIVCCDYREPWQRINGVKYIRMEAENADFYGALFEKGDTVIILKWRGVPATCLENGRELIESNIVGTMILIEACIAKQVKKIIFASSGGAIYGDKRELPIKEEAEASPISLYAIQKLMVEDYLRYIAGTKEQNVLILRISNPYGSGQVPFCGQGLIATFLACNLLGREAEIWGDGNSVRDYLYIDDLVQAVFLCVEKEIDSGTYNIGSGVGTSIFEICDLIESVTHHKMNYVLKSANSNQVKNNILDCGKFCDCTDWKCTFNMYEGLIKMKASWNGVDFRY